MKPRSSSAVPTWRKFLFRQAAYPIIYVALAAILAVPIATEAAGMAGQAVFNPASDNTELADCRRLADTSPEGALADLPAALVAAADELQALSDWNSQKRHPAKIGFSRPLHRPVSVSLAPLQTSEAAGVYAEQSGDRQWGGRVEVAGAHRLRLHLDDVNLPPDTRLWVYGEVETVAFGLDLVGPEGDLWTPSVDGADIGLEVHIPAGSRPPSTTPGFTVDAVIELFAADDAEPLGQPEASAVYECYVDAACHNNAFMPTLEDSKHAIGMMNFVKNGAAYSCTGGLLRDRVDDTQVPYFYTARHCVDSQTVASTLETYFDNIPSKCLGLRPPLDTLPRVNGSTLLETWANSDSTLLRLNAVPSGYRYYLGWTDAWTALGVKLSRLSHPSGSAVVPGYIFPQIFSQSSTITPRRKICTYSTSYMMAQAPVYGGTGPGADGAPSMDPSGQVRGHYVGQCAYDPAEPCNPANDTVDGRFSEFYPRIAKYIDALCVPDDTTLCLNQGRFAVRVAWKAQDGRSGEGRVVPFGSDTSGLFWFFNASNWEMLIKVLDGCGINNRFWVFFAATTDQEFTVTVTDSTTGTVKQYLNPMKHPADAVTDTDAFATCP